jgi:epoxyqueuosine reductase
MRTVHLSRVREIATGEGLSVVAVTSATPLVDDATYLTAWQRSRFAGEMEYMEREGKLLADPLRLLPSARSVVVFGASYDQGQVAECPPGFGRVARYAWGRDYHRVVKARVTRVLDRITAGSSREVAARVFTDSVPLLERALARRADAGFIGKNTLLIAPGFGSFLFLAEIIWDLEVEVDTAPMHPRASCGSCSRCLVACPTKAFAAPYSLDARRCISYLTIEKRTALSLEERGWIGEWIFGCDVCQEVCPFNFTSIKRGGKALIEPLRAEGGVGPLLSLSEVLKIRDSSSFVARFGGTALMRTKREGLLRNASIVAANTKAVSIVASVEDAARHDSSARVRQHALFAAASLARLEGSAAWARIRRLAEELAKSEDEALAQEARDLIYCA